MAGETVKRRQAVFNGQTMERQVTEKVAERLSKAERLNRFANESSLQGMLNIAKGFLQVDSKLFDAAPYRLNAGNGIIDLTSGELLPHSPKAYMTRSTGVDYCHDGDSELWVKTIQDIADGNSDLVRYLQIVAGYACSGDVSAQKFFYFYGEGANGKSLVTDLWAEALGGFESTGYAVRLQAETVTGSRERTAGAVSPDLLSLRGKRLALFSEPGGDMSINPQRLKDLTGGDSLTARAPHKAAITFRPSHTLIGCGNHMLQINDSGYAIARRMAPVPFRRTFEPSRLADELRTPEHLQAILIWMVRGAVTLQKSGWFTPAVVIDASKEYLDETDLIRQWISHRCNKSDKSTSSKILFTDYDKWRNERREPELSHSMFTRRLEKIGYRKRKSNGDSLVVGIELRQSHSESQPSADSGQPE